VITLYSANFLDGNILLTERTHTIRFIYSRSPRA